MLDPKHAAWRLFHPEWVPEADDPAVERLKRVRVLAGMVVSFGVYTFVAHDFDVSQVLENIAVAGLVLLVSTPLTVGVMLLVWRRGGPLRPLRRTLLGCLKLLVGFVGTLVGTALLFWYFTRQGGVLVLLPVVLWLWGFVVQAALRVNGNFFGTGAVHRCLPPVLAAVTSWLMALPDLATGDLHGLGARLGTVFILGAPVLVTAIALLEMRRVRRFHGIRLRDHPGVRHRAAHPPPRQDPAANPYGNGYGQPYGNGYGQPYGSGYGQPYGNPYAGGNHPYPGGNHPYPGGHPHDGGNPYA
ncbi:sulfur globule family protein [Streptomyces sclerotialus]|uniref:sulfur globule family protein n=1 Tax=Streptomyces sclerotialus TaxID=1957 RepID=UPI0004C972DE